MKSTYETMGDNYQPNGNYLMPDFAVPTNTKPSLMVSNTEHI